jgi:RNA polymerase sigma-70 factor (subfamily 1)
MRFHDFLRLLRAAQAGSAEALGWLFEAARPRLHHAASHRIEPGLLPKNSPSDLVQDAMLDACASIKNFKGHSQEEFDAWLRRILLNKVNNFRRAYRDREKREIGRESRLSSSDSGGPVPDDQAAHDERMATVRRAMSRLPRRHRRVLAMRFWQKLSYEDIGAHENRSPEAARKLCTRALRKLARALDNHPQQ